MAVDTQTISLTDDHTLETASEVMSHLQFDRRLPNGRQSYLELLKDLGFRNGNQDGEENTQFVLQGQCLILGDVRVGKTSLKKSLVGKPFDTEERRTKGVEISLVDRNWKNLDSEKGLTFGSFARFSESVLSGSTMYGPGGIKITQNQDKTSTTSREACITLNFLRFFWIIKIFELSFVVDSPVNMYARYAFFITTVLLVILLKFLPSHIPEHMKYPMLVVLLPRFIIGVGTVYILMGFFKGIECDNLEFSFLEIFSNISQYIYTAMLWSLISVDVYCVMVNYIGFFSVTLEGVESSLPGQARFNITSLPTLPQFVLFMLPVIISASFGIIVELITKKLTLQNCQTLYLAKIPIFCMLSFGLLKRLHTWPIWQGQLNLLLYIIWENTVVNLSYFYLFTIYTVIFALWACHTLYAHWVYRLFPFSGVIEYFGQQARPFTFIFIDKVVLNFQKLKDALRSKFSSLKLKLLDFSGDDEYYVYHHIFMRDHAIYIVVFNMANFVDNNFGNIGEKIRRLRFWLESICSKVAPKTPIFLVGTHKGHMDKTCLRSIDKHLQQHILHSFSDELVINKEDNLLYFPTENKLGCKDRGIQNLQKEIISTAEAHKTSMGKEIPYSWIKIQDAIINLRQTKNAKYCVPLQQFPVSVGNFICSNWSKETLKYFHEKGLIIYADRGQNSEVSEWILLKPDILVDVIIQLVTPLTDEDVILQHGFRRDLKRLHDTGMLTECLLDNIVSGSPEDGKALKGFLEEYDIICPLFFNVKKNGEEAHVTHFVPSLLPMSADVNTPVWQEGPDDKTFYVFFHRFLPEPLFQHLLSRAHKNSRAEFTMGQTVICKDVGRFWSRPRQPYRLLQLKDEDMIEVTFTYREGRGMKPSDVLVYIFVMISGICKQHFPYVKFHCGPLCPSDKCPGNQEDYISHPGEQQVCFRRHVFNVMPARQEAVVASFDCVNQNFEEQLKEWVV